MLALLGIALAHHDTAVAQVVPPSTPGWTGSRGPGLSFGLSYGVGSFARTLRGTHRWSSSTGSIAVHTLTVESRLQLGTGTGFRLSLPVGLTIAKGASDTMRAGPGDLALSVDQRIGPVSGRLGVSAPTGLYDPSPVLSVIDVSAEGGAVRLTTYDTRASLGTGAWTAVAGVDGRAFMGPVATTVAVGGLLPIDDTPDGIRWGPTGTAAVEAEVSVHPRARVGLGIDARHHGSDQMDTVDEDTGSPRVARFGARSAVGASLSVGVVPSARVRCEARAHLPVWQHVAGVQLVESVSAGLSCRTTRPLPTKGGSAR
ncbi:MAG: hypothetical protein R3F61_30190 [Myxococcota bacterium]